MQIVRRTNHRVPGFVADDVEWQARPLRPSEKLDDARKGRRLAHAPPVNVTLQLRPEILPAGLPKLIAHRRFLMRESRWNQTSLRCQPVKQLIVTDDRV